MSSVTNWRGRADRALADAKKDNDFIYHERILKVDELPALARAAVVKAAPLPEKFSGGGDLFDKLLPVHIHMALAAYDAKKQVTCVV